MFASLRALLATLVEAGELRLDLLGAELELERRRLLEVLVLGTLALMLLTAGVLALCGLVIVMLWDRYRLGAVVSVALVLLCLGLVALLLAHRRLRGGVGTFATSLALLRRDRARLRGTDRRL